MVSGPDGNVWFVEYAAAKIGRIVPSTGAITEYVAPTGASQPVYIVSGPDGNVWFTERAAGKIGKVIW